MSWFVHICRMMRYGVPSKQVWCPMMWPPTYGPLRKDEKETLSLIQVNKQGHLTLGILEQTIYPVLQIKSQQESLR